MILRRLNYINNINNIIINSKTKKSEKLKNLYKNFASNKCSLFEMEEKNKS